MQPMRYPVQWGLNFPQMDESSLFCNWLQCDIKGLFQGINFSELPTYIYIRIYILEFGVSINFLGITCGYDTHKPTTMTTFEDISNSLILGKSNPQQYCSSYRYCPCCPWYKTSPNQGFQITNKLE